MCTILCPVYAYKNWTSLRKWVVVLTTLRVSTYWVKLLYVMSKICPKVFIVMNRKGKASPIDRLAAERTAKNKKQEKQEFFGTK